MPAAEIFQNITYQLICDIEGAKNISDDILVYAMMIAQHDERLRKVLTRLESVGLVVSKEKCEFGKNELTFFGVKINEHGVNLDDKKREAIVKAGTPTTCGEIRSFLGLVTYCARFIRGFATLAEPLWR